MDDREFLKRRHLSRGRPRKYDPSSGKFESIQSLPPSPPAQQAPPTTALTAPPQPARTPSATNSAVAAVAAAAAGSNFIDFTRLIATHNAFTTNQN